MTRWTGWHGEQDDMVYRMTRLNTMTWWQDDPMNRMTRLNMMAWWTCQTYTLIVCCMSWHLKIVLSNLFIWTSLLYQQRYIVVSLSSDKCTHCKSLWIKVSTKCPKCKCKRGPGATSSFLSRPLTVCSFIHPDGLLNTIQALFPQFYQMNVTGVRAYNPISSLLPRSSPHHNPSNPFSPQGGWERSMDSTPPGWSDEVAPSPLGQPEGGW